MSHCVVILNCAWLPRLEYEQTPKAARHLTSRPTHARTQRYFPARCLTLGSEDHPTASSVCCGWRNTPCHCPDASLWRQMGQKEHAQWAQRFLENSTLDGIRGITWPRGEEEKKISPLWEKSSESLWHFAVGWSKYLTGVKQNMCMCVCQSDHRHTAESVYTGAPSSSSRRWSDIFFSLTGVCGGFRNSSARIATPTHSTPHFTITTPLATFPSFLLHLPSFSFSNRSNRRWKKKAHPRSKSEPAM